ncbi:MAG: C80 family cysteine peptidase, partial [Desulfobacterales bacterium]|nr:C80 family cysteine peptidase [Desulfobacterales bacterium]
MKINFGILSRFSAEDVVFSVLSNEEVQQLRDWYRTPANREQLLGLFQAENLGDGPNLSVAAWLDNVLDVTAGLRLEAGQGQLEVSPYSVYYSPLADGTDRQVQHMSHPSPESRRPFVFRDGEFYGAIEYRDVTNPANRLAASPYEWLNGNRATLVRGLLAEVDAADPYAAKAAALQNEVDTILSRWNGRPPADAAAARTAVDQIMSRVGILSPTRDSAGRLSQHYEAWWRQVHRTGSELEAGLRTHGVDLNSQWGRSLRSTFDSRWGVDLASPADPFAGFSFSDNQFNTWRGTITAQELGLAQGWQPGMDIPGFNMVRGQDGSYTYVPLENGGVLGREFSLSWNGLSWPSPQLLGLSTLTPPDIEAVNFTDSSNQSHTIDIPDGSEALGRSHRIWTVSTAQGDVALVVNLEDYLQNPDALNTDLASFRQYQQLLGDTQAGREFITHLQTQAAAQVQYASGSQVNGLNAELFNNRDALAYVVHMGPNAEGWARVAPSSGTGHLVVVGTRPLGTGEVEGLEATSLDYFRQIYQIRNQVTLATGSMTDAQYQLASQYLTQEHAFAREIGFPLRERIDIGRVENLVVLDGSIPLLDENYRPISPRKVYFQNLMNRHVELVKAQAADLNVTITDITVDPASPLEGIDAIIARLDQQIPADRAGRQVAMDNLANIRRALGETQYILEGNTQIDVAGRFLSASGTGFPDTTLANAQAYVTERTTAWNERTATLAAANEAGPQVENMVVQELERYGGGTRTLDDITSWLDNAHENIRNFALSETLVNYLNDSDDPRILGLLSEYETELTQAWERGTLTGVARLALAVRLNQIRLSEAAETGVLSTSELTLDSLRTRFVLELLVPRSNGVRSRNSEGEIVDGTQLRNEAVSTSLSQANDQRSGLAQTVAAWRRAQTNAPASWRGLETTLTRGVALENGEAPRSILTRVYNRETGVLEGIGLAVEQISTGDFRISAIAWDPNGATANDHAIGRDILIENIRAIHAEAPQANIRFTPGHDGLMAEARGLFFTPDARVDLFNTDGLGVTVDTANAGIETLQGTYMDLAVGRLNELTQRLQTSDRKDVLTAVESLRDEWNDLKAANSFEVGPSERAEVYYRLRQQIGDLGYQMIQRAVAGEIRVSTDEFNFFQRLHETAPGNSTQEQRFSLVNDTTPLVVVALEDDPTVGEAARFLAEKHGGPVSRYRLINGEFVLESGPAPNLTAESKIYVVGHGTPNRVSGMTASDIIGYMVNQGILASGDEIRRISVVACSTDDPKTPVEEGTPRSRFGEALIETADDLGVTVGSVSLRTDLVTVDSGGRKWYGTPDSEGRVLWSRNGDSEKLIVQRRPDGSLGTRRVALDHGLTETHWGDASQALGLTDGIVRFVNGTQVDENGLAVEASSGISAEALAVVQTLLGENPTGVVEINNGDIRVISTESIIGDGINAQDASVKARDFVGRLSDGRVTAQDAAQEFLYLSEVEQAAVGNELLKEYGDHPESVNLRAGVRSMNPMLRELLDNGSLNSHSRFVIEVALEQFRIQRTAELRGVTGSVEYNIILDSHRAELALETAQTRAPALRRVTVDERGITHTSTTNPEGTTYTNEIYSLRSFAGEDVVPPPLISRALLLDVTALMTHWLNTARTQGDAGFYGVYESVRDALRDGGVRSGENGPIRPTNVVITRAPDSSIAAVGLHSFVDGVVWKDYTVTDARLRVQPRPAGEYWLGAGYENIISSLREITSRYPELPLRATTVNAQSHLTDVNLYYNEGRIGQLLPALTATSFVAASQSLLNRKIALLNLGLTELEAGTRAHATPGETARITALRTRISELTTQVTSGATMENFLGLDGLLDTARTDLAGISQAIRLAHPTDITLAGLGSNARFLDTAFQPTSDGLHNEYNRLVQTLTDQGLTLPSDISGRAGTLEDFSRLFEFAGVEATPVQAGILENLRTGSLPGRIPADTLAIFEGEVRTALDQKAASLSTLLKSYGEDPSSAMADILGADSAWILKFYQEERLSPSARLVVETQLERIRLADTSLRTVHGTTDGFLFMDPSRATLLLNARGSQVVQYLDIASGVATTRSETGAYGHSSYLLLPDTVAAPAGRTSLTGAEKAAVLSQLNSWAVDSARIGLGSEVTGRYNLIINAISDGAVDGSVSGGKQIMVTRRSNGDIVAVTLYSHDSVGKMLTVEASVESAYHSDPTQAPDGRVYINGDKDAIRAVVREARAQYPESRIRVNPVDAAGEQFLRENYFSNTAQSRLFESESTTALGSYTETQRTLLENQLHRLNAGAFELDAYSSANPNILAGHWQNKLDTLSRRIRTMTADLDDAEGTEISVLGEELYEMQRRFANIADFTRINSGDPAGYNGALSADSLELVRQHNTLPSDATEVFQRLVGELPRDYAYKTFFENAKGTPTEFVQLLSQLGAILEPDEFAARLEPVFRDAAADRISAEVRDYLADALVLASTQDIQSVGEAIGSIEDFGVVQDFARTVDTSLSADIVQRHLPYWGGYWDENYGPEEGIDVETLRQSGPDGEPFTATRRPGRDETAIRFRSGVQVDEFGLPVLPTSEGALSAADVARVTTALGTDFTGKVKVSPTEVVEVPPQDVVDLNPDLVHPDGAEWDAFRERFEQLRRDGLDTEPFDVRGDIADVPELFRHGDENLKESIAPADVIEESHVYRGNPDSPLSNHEGISGVADPHVGLVAFEQEVIRLQEIRDHAVSTRISQYEQTHSTTVVLDPETVTRTQNRFNFSVVGSSDVDADGNIRDGATRIPLVTDDVPGYGDASDAALQRLIALSAQEGENPSRAWASFLGSRRRQEALAYTPEAGTQPSTPAEPSPRSLVKAMETVKGRAIVAKAISSTESLIRTHNLATSLTSEWVPVLATLEERPGGTYRIQFMNKLNSEQTRWIETQDDSLFKLKAYMDEQLETEHAALRRRRTGAEPDAEAPDGLNAAFLVQFVVNLAQEYQRQGVSQGASGTLHTALEVHRWLFGAQVLFGAATDTVKLVRLAKSLLQTSEALSGATKASHALAYAGEAVGVGFMTANVILDSIQIANAENDAQKAVFGTQLAFDATGLILSSTALGLSITAGVAGYVAANTAVAATAATAGAVATGAATAGAIVGGAGVIVAGLGIGAAALAQNYSIIADEAKAIGKYFKTVYDAYKETGFDLITSNGTNILAAKSGAVVTNMNFRNATLGFGTHYMNQTTHGSSGSGKINYFGWVNDGPVENTDAQINIAHALGVTSPSYTLSHRETEVIVLPATPETHLSGYDYQTLPGAVTRDDPGFGVLRTLEQDETFDFDYYLWPSEYILHKIDNFEYRNVITHIYLDGNSRTLLMPDLPSEHNNKIEYKFHGQGGNYVIGLNEGYRLITLGNDGSTASTWVFDTANLDTQNVTFHAGLNQLHIGGTRLWLSSSVRANNNLMLLNHARDVYSINWSSRTTSLVSIDGQGHGDHASLLTYL